MEAKEQVQLTRDCDAILIPNAIPVLLKKGDLVTITQELGGSYTIFVNGNLARIEGTDSDALGKEQNTKTTIREPHELTGDGTVSLEKVWEVLRECYDPEIPVNIVDLGLIYNCHVEPQEFGNLVSIEMTLTAPGCGMGPFLVDDIKDKLLQVANVTEVEVELVWDPPWDQSRMSDEAKLELGLF